MRLMRTAAVGTMLLVSVGSQPYARALGRDAVRTSGESTRSQEPSSTTNQDQTKPPRQTPPPKQIPPPKQQSLPKPKIEPPKTEEAKPPKLEKKPKEQSRQEQKQQKQPTGNSVRIPSDQFKANFGQAHTFKATQVITTTRIVPHQTQFVHFGYTFVFVDPWPPDWLLTDDRYIDDIDHEYFCLTHFTLASEQP